MIVNGDSSEPLRSLTPRELQYFLAVAENLNFHRAANQLFISQPSLSRQIKTLEERLGVALFDRSTRKVQLTAHGQLFTPLVRELLASINAGIQDAKEASRRSATLQIFHCAEGSGQATKLGAQLRERTMGAEIHIHEVTKPELAERITSSKDTIGVGSGFKDHTERAFWAKDPIVALLPQRHALSGSVSVNIGDLLDYRSAALGPEDAPGLRARFKSAGIPVPALENGSEEFHLSSGIIVIDVESRCTMLSSRYQATRVRGLTPVQFRVAGNGIPHTSQTPAESNSPEYKEF